ncbi:hypothetical protein E3N88_45364 [Mikania micrantha]|uniref:Uncharacterized protein n=1 Tax=Mikania micrantha TaxID=192012 RepID=A0A5N6L9E3_9ASTR|nr:hypothetical protein E3N88_45364 [Mikania micrantha]
MRHGRRHHPPTRLEVFVPSSSQRESMLMDGKKIEDWLSELDTNAKEVEVELISRDIGCHLIEVLEAHYPLRPVQDDKTDGSSIPTLHPQDLSSNLESLYGTYENYEHTGYHGIREATDIAASQLGFKARSWRDVVFTREYGEAVQELSICMIHDLEIQMEAKRRSRLKLEEEIRKERHERHEMQLQMKELMKFLTTYSCGLDADGDDDDSAACD